VNSFPLNQRFDNDPKRVTSEGISPVRLLSLRFNTLKKDKLPRLDGRFPVNLLFAALNDFMFLISPIPSGSCPSMLLLDKSTSTKDANALNSFGIGPDKLLLGRRIF